MLSAPIDLDKAEALLRADGLEVVRPTGSRSVGGWTPEARFRADGRFDGLNCVLVDADGRAMAVVNGLQRHAEDMEYVAAELLRAAALCRQIEAECREVKP